MAALQEKADHAARLDRHEGLSRKSAITKAPLRDPL
jgi:hypothetical protein